MHQDLSEEPNPELNVLTDLPMAEAVNANGVAMETGLSSKHAFDGTFILNSPENFFPLFIDIYFFLFILFIYSYDAGTTIIHNST